MVLVTLYDNADTKWYWIHQMILGTHQEHLMTLGTIYDTGYPIWYWLQYMISATLNDTWYSIWHQEHYMIQDQLDDTGCSKMAPLLPSLDLRWTVSGILMRTNVGHQNCGWKGATPFVLMTFMVKVIMRLLGVILIFLN